MKPIDLDHNPLWYASLQWVGLCFFPVALAAFVLLFDFSGLTVWSFFAFVLGGLAADFVSGLVHWWLDTWGKASWPVIGRSLIRPFRQHHIDPLAMTTQSLGEINGTLFGLSGLTLCVLYLGGEAFALSLDLQFGIFVFVFYSAFTNWIHQSAHHPNPNSVYRLLSGLHLVLKSKKHNEHHSQGFSSSYCISTGWLNPFLNRVRFFRHAESFVSAITGMRPRDDEEFYLRLHKG